MPTPEEYLEFFYPYLVDESDPRFIPGADVDQALTIAEAYRPSCLTVDRQNQAQAHYACYVLEFRRSQMEAGGGGVSSTIGTSVTAGSVTRKTEGDVTVQYGTTSGSSSSGANTTARNTNPGPSAPYASFLALWLVCSPADINGPGQGNVGSGGGGSSDKPVPRGSIITRFGWPKP